MTLSLPRTALPLIIGITSGYALSGVVAPVVWSAALVVAVALSFLLRGNGAAQCLFIYIAAFFLGSFLVTIRLKETALCLPDGYVDYEAVVVNEPTEHEKTVGCDIIITSSQRQIKAKAYIRKDEHAYRLHAGSGIRACSRLQTSRNDADSYSLYLLSHGIAARTFVESRHWQEAAVDGKKLSLLQRARLSALRLRHHLLEQYAAWGLEEQSLAVVSALTLGDKSLLADSTRADYSRAGASHILALSGMHLTIIYGIILVVVGKRRRNLTVAVVTTLSLWAFAFITGMSPSITRAALMLTIFTFCDMLNRGRLSLNALALAAMVMLTISPLSLYDVGFQLSFMAMLSITLLLGPAMSVVPDALMRYRLPGYIVSAVILSVTAQIGTFPLVAYYFGNNPVYALLSNLLVVICATVILYGAVLFFIVSPLPVLRCIVADGLRFAADTMNAGVEKIASLPGADALSFSPDRMQVVLIYLTMFAVYLLCRFMRHTLAVRA